jgi:NAD(P)-dependent dehydrogenase (short-subunit alcohol dehydrogenase family)
VNVGEGQEVAKAMKGDGKGGSVVVTASVAAIRGTPAMPAYVASKAALIGPPSPFCICPSPRVR